MLAEFLKYQAQTSERPLGLIVTRAEGSFIYDSDGKKYLDLIGGVSANTLGHNHPAVTKAIIDQIAKYTHVMVYGEFILGPPLALCKLLSQQLGQTLDTVYLTNSGTEATEGALKLAKRFTGRFEILAAKHSYHGNTQGAMSVSGNESAKAAFRPLIPGIDFLEFNNVADLQKITTSTAAVILETIQGGAGFIEPKDDYLFKVKKRCQKVGALLILDEIQTGIGRTGKLFGFQNYNVRPDILICGKGLGGGMPIGAFIASNQLMACLKENPKLGHITTFGGHPVIAAAALATLTEILSGNLIKQTLDKELLFRKHLKHPQIKEIRGKGLMLALIMDSAEIASKIILSALNNGLLLFWLLFEKKAIRISPPLTISKQEIIEGCKLLLEIIESETNHSV